MEKIMNNLIQPETQMSNISNLKLYSLSRLCQILFVICCVLGGVFGQDKSQYDQGTAPQHAAGVSAVGSYISTELGNINLANGAMNMKLPVGDVGGRGFSVPLTVNYSHKLWSVQQGTEYASDGPIPYQIQQIAWAVYDDPDRIKDNYSDFLPGWTIGAAPMLKARGIGISPANPQGCPGFFKVVVKLTLVLPDKGEIEFRDDARNGEPAVASLDSYGCNVMDYSRGQRWHAADGSGAIYINDVNNGAATGNLNGWVITADGMRYRFEGTSSQGTGIGSAYLQVHSRAVKIVDRNGNVINISYPNANEVQYTDQLGRITRLQYNTPDPQNLQQTLALLITLPGYQGQPRYYKLKKGIMNQNFRAGLNVATPVINGFLNPNNHNFYSCGDLGTGQGTTLFPQSHAAGCERIDDNQVLTDLVLPDGRAVKFAYNEFGEVAEVTMPTGGKIQYDYAYVSTLPAGNSASFETEAQAQYSGRTGARTIDRAIVARRVYNELGLESSWTYQYSPAAGSTGAKTVVQARDAANTLLMNQHHYFLPAGRYITATGGTGNSLWSTGLEYRTETRDALENIIAASEEDWSQRTPIVWTGYYPTEQISNDNRVNVSRSILDDGKTARTETDYDQFSNPTEIRQYDFDNSLKRKTTTSYLSVNPVNGTDYTSDAVRILRLPVLQRTFDGNGVKAAESVVEYDRYTADGNNAALTDYGTVIGFDSINYGTNRPARGNPTSSGAWRNTDNSYLYGYTRFDVLGNVVSAKDAKGNVSSISYTDDYGDGTNPGGGTNGTNGVTYANATVLTSPAPNTGAAAHVAKAQFDFSSGLLTGFRDRNNIVTQTFYNDAFNRPTLVKTALGTPLERHAESYYAQATAQTIYGVTLERGDSLSRADLFTVGDGLAKSWVKTDGFGRTLEAWGKSNDGDVKAQTIYDGLGRAKKATNPYRPALNEPVYWTENFYDLAGRTVKVKTPDNAEINTGYVGNAVTVTDQAGKQRRSITNGIGQLTRVDEPTDVGGLGAITAPNQPTFYAYDTLSNLTTVQQSGNNTLQCGGTVSNCTQTRTYTYNSLSQLKSATNPESGLIQYSYDNNGNLTQKIDARNVQTNYTYDALNRVLTRGYTDGITPAVTYFYDNLPNAKGKLIKVSSSVSTTEYTSFDILDRLLAHKQTTDGNAYTTAYSYNLSGALIEETYPSTRVVKNVLDNDGDLAIVQSKKNQNSGFFNYAENFTYTAAGAVSSLQLGNGKWESTQFNSRLQPTQIALGTVQNGFDKLKLNFDYGTTTNNGNVQSQTITVPTTGSTNGFTAIQTYNYDSLNRLKSAEEKISNVTSWKQTFTFDRFGNRNFDTANTTTLGSCATAVCNPTIDPATNRLVGYTFDNAGNTKVDATGRTFTYDADNKQVEVKDASNASIGQYFYDGDGKRVKKYIPLTQETTIFVYDASGKLVAEYSTTTNNNPQVSYLTSDTLGSPRITTNANGQVYSRRDFMPFGEEITSTQTAQRSVNLNYGEDGIKQKFTSYERDNESDLDFAQSRMFVNKLGRFTTIDPAPFSPANPQELNRFLYVQNNPLKYIDPSGETFVLNGDDADYLVTELEKKTGYQLERDKKTGVVTIKEGKRKTGKGISDSLAKILKKVTDKTAKVDGKEKEFTVTLNTVKNSESIFIDSFQTKQIDVSDLTAISDVKDDKGMGDGGAFLAGQLGHVLEESFQAETTFKDLEAFGRGSKGLLFKAGHNEGLVAESRVLSDFTGQSEEPRKENNTGTAAAFTYTSVRYTVLFNGANDQTVNIISRRPIPKQ